MYIANQEDNIKTKNITEKITFESKLWKVPSEKVQMDDLQFVFFNCFSV